MPSKQAPQPRIRGEASYQKYLAEADVLVALDPRADSPQGKRLNLLVPIIQAWEEAAGQRRLAAKQKSLAKSIQNLLQSATGTNVDFCVIVSGATITSKPPPWMSYIASRKSPYPLFAMWCMLREAGVINASGREVAGLRKRIKKSEPRD